MLLGWVRGAAPVALLALALLCAPAARAQDGTTLMAISRPAPSAPSPTSLAAVLPAARDIMARDGTVWAKATAIRELVRRSLPPGTSCGTMGLGFWSVGTMVGLPLRIVQLSANGRNGWDTHVTVEVWDSSRMRWEVSDPTFDGYWTQGADRAPIGAEQVHAAALSGATGALEWHGTGAPNAILASQYYVDPPDLYRWVEISAYVAGRGYGYVVDHAGDAFSDAPAFVPLSPTDLGSVPPGDGIPIEAVTPDLSAFATSAYTAPPAYADTLVLDATLPVTTGAVTVRLPPLGSAAVLAVDASSGAWQLQTSSGTYALDQYAGTRVSPIVWMSNGVTLTGAPAGMSRVRVRVWTVKRFPTAHEGPADWNPAAPSLSYGETAIRVGPSGVSGDLFVDYGETTAYGETRGPFPVTGEPTSVRIDDALPGLSPGATYHWRARFVDTGVTVVTGLDQTLAVPPTPLPPPSAPATPPAPATPDSPPPAPTRPLDVALARDAANRAAHLLRLHGRLGRTSRIVVPVASSSPGSWRLSVRKASRPGRPHPTTLGRGALSLLSAGRGRLVVQLTHDAPPSFRTRRRLHLVVQASFDPVAGGRVTANVACTVRP